MLPFQHNYYMKKFQPVYSIPVRLSHGLTFILLILLIWTGFRLAWLHYDRFTPQLSSMVDSLTPGGTPFSWHVLLGYLLLLVGLFYIFYMLFAPEGKRLLLPYRHQQYPFAKKIIYYLSFFIAATIVFTGISIYKGLYEGSEGYLFNSLLHRYSAYIFLLFTLWHIIDSVVSSRTKINAMFFQRTKLRVTSYRVLVISIVISTILGGSIIVFTEKPNTLICRNVNKQIIIDGTEDISEWADADSVVIQVWGGSNSNADAVPVTLKTMHNQREIFFLVRWSDPTLSFNRYLVKTDSGWVEERSVVQDIYGETIYSEDKLGLSFSNNRGGCATTCHVPAYGKLGLHYTDGDTVDVWEWMAVSTNPALEADDWWWGEYINDTIGGRHADNKASGGYQSNLNREWKQPYFLPTHPSQRFWIWYGSPKYTPYYPELDTFQIGSRVPSLLVAPTTGDRGDIKARGIWKNGVWTVELSRELSTGSQFDIPMRNTIYLNLALFDNADSKHAIHVVPIQIDIK